jgi:hypothetical protein
VDDDSSTFGQLSPSSSILDEFIEEFDRSSPSFDSSFRNSCKQVETI